MSRPAFVHSEARGSAVETRFKSNLLVSHLREELLLAFSNSSNLGR
jgi:hypothetical protein